MADSFFELKNSLNEVDGEFPDSEEDEYDALNDETFGSDAIVADEDWEDTHTLLAAATESTRGRDAEEGDRNRVEAEKSLSRLLLSDDDHHQSPGPPRNLPLGDPRWRPFGPPPGSFDKSPPMPLPPPPLSRIPTVEELERKIMEGKGKAPSSPRPVEATPPRAIRPAHGHMATPHGLRTPSAPPGLPLPQHRHQNHFGGPYPLPGPPFPGPKVPPGFPGPHMHPAMAKNMGRNHPHQMTGMPPHMAQEYMMMRSQYDKVGMPLMMPGMPMMPPRMGPPPGMGMFSPLLNPQMRPDFMFGFDAARNNFHPPHPLLYQHLNHQKMQQQQQQQQIQNHLNWQQKQLYDRSSSVSTERDEYAKLMNNRERTWLLNIQIMQLTTDKPHVDDYYYTMWKKKHPTQRKPEALKNGFHKDHRRAEAFFANNRPNENQRERRDSENTNATSSSSKVYVPLQFENSLGKLQAKSVIAPRVVFDIDVVSDSQSGPQPGPAHKDHRKTKKILLELERLYLLMMDAEEAEDNQDVDSDVTKADLVNRVLVGLLNEERYLSFLCIRKGKVLLIRCLGHITEWESPVFTDLWSRLLKAFPTVLRRDKDDALLPKLYPFLKRWADSASWKDLVQVARSVLGGVREGRTSVLRASPSPTKPVLSYILSNKFGVSAVTKLLVQGETVTSSPSLSQSETAQWKSFVDELVKSIASLDSLDNVVRPIEPIPHNILTGILTRRCTHLNAHVHNMANKVLG